MGEEEEGAVAKKNAYLHCLDALQRIQLKSLLHESVSCLSGKAIWKSPTRQSMFARPARAICIIDCHSGSRCLLLSVTETSFRPSRSL